MTRIIRVLGVMMAAMVFGAGCASNNGGGGSVNSGFTMVSSGSVSRACVAVGLTSVNSAYYNGWVGECPGCDFDAQSIYTRTANSGMTSTLIMNQDATWKNVKANVLLSARGMKRGDLLIIMMSSHGGQLPDDNGDEADGIDETICLWDGAVRDDEVLKLIKALPPGLRIVLINDQCHSEGNFSAALRAVQRGVTFGLCGKTVARPLLKAGDYDGQVIQFAGCREATYSYGSDMGGTWTQTLLATLTPDSTWRTWFEAAAAKMPAQQIPVWVEFGNVTDAFRNGPVFQ